MGSPGKSRIDSCYWNIPMVLKFREFFLCSQQEWPWFNLFETPRTSRKSSIKSGQRIIKILEGKRIRLHFKTKVGASCKGGNKKQKFLKLYIWRKKSSMARERQLITGIVETSKISLLVFFFLSQRPVRCGQYQLPRLYSTVGFPQQLLFWKYQRTTKPLQALIKTSSILY